MGSVDRLLDPTEGNSAEVVAIEEKPTPPKGFEPGIKFSGRSGTITSRPQENPNPNWENMLREWGFDPKYYRVVEPVEIATWDSSAKVQDEEGGPTHIETKQLWSFRAKIESVTANDVVDLESLIEDVRRARKSKKPKAKLDSTPSSMVVGLADWQMGKDDGYGVEGTIHQIENMIEQVPVRALELRKMGRRIDNLYVFGLGDLTEGCGGHYEQQTFRVKLDRRDQIKVVRRLLRDAFMYWVSENVFENIIGSAIGGNHGENRSGIGGGSKSFTTFNDNDDVAVFEQVAEILSANPSAYDHVSFALPTDRLTMCLDVSGQKVAITHGHTTKARSGEPTKLMWDWWQGQAFGKNSVASDADILLAGHYHHFVVKEQLNRTLMIAPTVDGGSMWFEQTTGMASKPGTITFVCAPDGWSDMHIISSKKVS